MKTGFRGAFVISWMQSELDGQSAAPIALLRAGQCWRWWGEAVRIDGPQAVLQLAPAADCVALHQRAGPVARRLLAAVGEDVPHLAEVADPVGPDQSFTVTDGRRGWPVTVILAGRTPLVAFTDGVPPRDADLWIVAVRVGVAAAPPAGVICFTAGTMILTETGPVPVGALAPGDRVQTKDNGCQPVDWIGQSRVSGARLRAMPHLAPVRLRAGALDDDVPDTGLLVSPDHRIMLRGPRARALFNADEVLVAARDLVDDRGIRVERGLPEVTYFHLLLPRHEILFANGVEADSFHPAEAAWMVSGDGPPAGFPADPATYGGYARRILNAGEAAILRHDLS